MSDTPASAAAAPVSFEEFSPVTTEQWWAQLGRELKGQDPASLRWPTAEGFALEPFYHREAWAALGGPPPPLPPRPAPCRNVPSLNVATGTDGRAQIDLAADWLARGADGVHFVLSGDPSGFAVQYLAERLPLHETFLGFSVTQAPDRLLDNLAAAAAEQPLRGFLRFAPGPVPEGAELGGFQTALRRCVAQARDWPEFRTLAVNAAFFGNRGATLTQQLAFGLSAAAALLAETPDEAAGLTVADAARALHLHVAVGPSYFPEIARLRATRRLWATLLHAYGLPSEAAAELRIHAATATWTQTVLDPHTNLLRHTTEAMSAVLGGADSVQVAPFDCLYQAPNEFSARLARNLPVILREEAGLGRVADPAAGSYFLEALTDQLAREAWALFQQTEARGGVVAARGWALGQVSQAALEKFKRIAAGHDVVVGTNRFQNPHETFDYEPKKLLRSREFDTTRATYPAEVLRLATALHFERRAKKDLQAALVLLGDEQVNRLIEAEFRRLLGLPSAEASRPVAPPASAAYSVLFSSPEEATLMYATPAQFERAARLVQHVPEGEMNFDPPAILSADLATLQEVVRVFNFEEFVVEGHRTDDVLARLQGR